MAEEVKQKHIKNQFRIYCRRLHNHLSFFFAGVIVIYAISGITMNHLKDFNPQYMISVDEYQLQGSFPRSNNAYSKAEVIALLNGVNETENYMKHYYPNSSTMKVFLKGGSSFSVDTKTGMARYEGIKKRPIFSQLSFLHYNPNAWWTAFSDIFAGCLIIITLTGIFMVKGKGSFIGMGGIKFAAGLLIPILILLFC